MGTDSESEAAEDGIGTEGERDDEEDVGLLFFMLLL